MIFSIHQHIINLFSKNMLVSGSSVITWLPIVKLSPLMLIWKIR